jgi:hypothetical protein
MWPANEADLQILVIQDTCILKNLSATVGDTVSAKPLIEMSFVFNLIRQFLLRL